LSNFFFSLSFVKHGAGGKNVPECNPEPLYLKEKKKHKLFARSILVIEKEIYKEEKKKKLYRFFPS
jgi:hypothetical protein